MGLVHSLETICYEIILSFLSLSNWEIYPHVVHRNEPDVVVELLQHNQPETPQTKHFLSLLSQTQLISVILKSLFFFIFFNTQISVKITGLSFKSWKNLEKGREKIKRPTQLAVWVVLKKNHRVFRQSVVRIVVWKYNPKGRVSRETMGKE